MTRCTLGVGCEEFGVCYAAAHGQPDQCGASVITIGTHVRVFIPGHGTPPSESWVIGRMHYGEEVVCVATETTTGMPVHEAHCTPIDGDDLTNAMIWRKRYLDQLGQHWFKAIS